MELVTLKNGSQAFLPMVSIAMVSLHTLLEENPIAFYELVMKCRDSSHRLFGNTNVVLGEFNLIKDDAIDATVRGVVLSAVQGDGLDMTLGSPVQNVATIDTVSSEKTARLDDFELYCAVRQIGDRICEIAKKHGCWFEDWRSESPNTCYNQTASGLFIEHYYGGVNKLWTPWGCYDFIGGSSGKWDEVWKEVAELLGATLLSPEVTNSMGAIGPVFTVNKFEERTLPQSVLLDRHSYDSSADVTAAWNKLSAQYLALKQ